MATREWRVLAQNGFATQAAFAGSPLGSTNSAQLCGWNAGETILRTRVQGHMAYEIRDTTPTMTQLGTIIAGGEFWTWGVWADKTGVVVPAQTPPITGALRDEFVFWNQMQLAGVNQFSDQLGEDRWIAHYTFPWNTCDSTSSRGPAQVNGEIVLTWGFGNSNFEPMINTQPGISAFLTWALTWEVLIEMP